MTKSKFSASSIAVPSIFVILFENGAQFLNTACVPQLHPKIVISPRTRM